MGHQAQIKDMRKQLRNVTQEILPSLLQTEVFKDLYGNLQKEMLAKLNDIETHVKESLAKIDDRSKDVQSFIMSQVQAQMAGIPSTPITENPVVENTTDEK